MKKILMSLVTAVILASVLCISAHAANVAMVGDTEYETIDEAIAAWAKGTTLTLLDDVTLSDVIELDNREPRTLDLGEYTMTAASGKNAITLMPLGDIKGSNPIHYFTVNADAENPGGISAPGATCIESLISNNNWACKMEIVINGGVFNGKYCIKHSKSIEQSAPWITINDGVFNGTSYAIHTNKAKIHIKGGEFNGNTNFQGTETGSYTVISGGRIKSLGFITAKVNALCFGTDPKSMQNYDCDVYMDDEGYFCVVPVTENEAVYEASVAASVANSYVKNYSNVKNTGAFGYTDANVALAKNTSAEVKLYGEATDNLTLTGKSMIIDLTDERAAYTGVIALNAKTAAVKVRYNVADILNVNVVNGAKVPAYKVTYTEETSDDIVTRTYALEFASESTEKVIVDGTKETVEVSAKAYIDDKNGGFVDVSIPSEVLENAGNVYLKVSASVGNAFGENAVIYDVNLVNEEGEKIPAEGTFTVKLPYLGKADEIENYEVFYLNGEMYEDMNAEYDEEENVFVFTVNHFSEYVIADIELMESGITKNISIEYRATANPNVYDIYAVAGEDKKINRFSSVQLKFDLWNDPENRTDVAYTLAPAENIKMSEPDADGYVLFNFDGVNAEDSKVASEVLFATVTFEGYGKFKFSTVDTASKAKLHTATIIDNIVVDYVCDVSSEYKLNIQNTIEAQLYVPVTNLKVNISFPNTINDNAFAYQDMTLTVSGGDLEEDLVVKLGGDFDISELSVYNGRKAPNVTADFVSGAYVVEINQLLTVNTSYVVTVEGAGYRTARYTVNTQETDKTLNFWNNVKDNKVEIEEDKETSAKNVTFLAGDIVKDSLINIYDLSAVVSYFGEIMNVTAEHPYAKYDLNRDGKIDSKDVAYVLVSWNN